MAQNPMLEKEFDDLMLRCFSHQEIAGMSENEVKERKLLFYAGSHAAISIASSFGHPFKRCVAIDLLKQETQSFINKFNKENNQ